MSKHKQTERTKNAEMTGDLKKQTHLTVTLTENHVTNRLHAYGLFVDHKSAEDHLVQHASSLIGDPFTDVIHKKVDHAKPDGTLKVNLNNNKNRWIIVVKDLKTTHITVKGFFASSKDANTHIRIIMPKIDKSLYHAVYVLPVIAYNQITVRG